MASTATIKAIESSTVHQIQSGQVIVDLCSVAKELIENSVDAGATTIEVRFKNQGLDSIEIQDNGSGIAPHNYGSIALKHYTSKLSSYDDLSTLQTFGFRGEALSSLCALSRFAVVTCTQQEAPRATRLEFDIAGKLASTGVVSGQKGTTVIVEDLFHNLPVRRRELERNIKREWGKVISLLNQYACVQTGVKFTVSQQPTKGKRMILFSTRGNPTTRDNIINVFGVKTTNALITMDLVLSLTPTTTAGPNKGKGRADSSTTEIRVCGHVSRPAHGEGRQTPDRQMFHVNGRPCGLPQFAKVFNEVYRSYNASQSPFIFADIQLDTHLYDVNVSPDKRTILLHDQGQMLDNLRESLIELFETQDVTIPVSRASELRQTPLKPCSVARSKTPVAAQPIEDEDAEISGSEGVLGDVSEAEEGSNVPQVRYKRRKLREIQGSAKGVSMLSSWLKKDFSSSGPSNTAGSDSQQQAAGDPNEDPISSAPDTGEGHSRKSVTAEEQTPPRGDTADEPGNHHAVHEDKSHPNLEMPGFQRPNGGLLTEKNKPFTPVFAIPPPSQPLPLRSSPLRSPRPRPLKRSTEEIATITIGDDTVTSVIGSPAKRPKMGESSKTHSTAATGKEPRRGAPLPSFGGRLSQLFSASARPSQGGLDELEVETESGEEDLDEDVDEEVDKGTDGEIDEEPDDETDDGVEGPPDADVEEDSLFISQAEHSEPEHEHDDESEQLEDPMPGSAQTEHGFPTAAARPSESTEHSSSCHEDHAGDDEHVDETEKKAQEDKTVQEMIDAAETGATGPTDEGEKRSETFVKGRSRRKDMTFNLSQEIKTSSGKIQQQMAALASRLPPPGSGGAETESKSGLDAPDAEEKLSLKITKSDFAKMRIVGQFNLGFILAVREAASSPDAACKDTNADDELFIIDQHASDEKYNFERLQATTTVQSQRLVQPKTLDLTALEEEIILEHVPALERNGFLVQADTSGARPVGARIRLLSLPLSRETTFSLADLEELVGLLADSPTASGAATVPRPSRVRRMLAMRACRSSIMIGRALARRQMEAVVRHMGEMEKPWNCPHGRPTMRHLCGLGGWDGRGWVEGDGLGG
ncbi:DNA mismatch repair protein MutL [Trichocladium antarcticum]|uniref:DNA mismatch repair protein PMS1 n=1 Tax=Trichocladium antarcticum TaxID=1450529 RepID=A0AAN6UK50_9PEZI|nr:DNA mismatch repair protein MutL [Trichocladium antarcticum]